VKMTAKDTEKVFPPVMDGPFYVVQTSYDVDSFSVSVGGFPIFHPLTKERADLLCQALNVAVRGILGERWEIVT